MQPLKSIQNTVKTPSVFQHRAALATSAPTRPFASSMRRFRTISTLRSAFLLGVVEFSENVKGSQRDRSKVLGFSPHRDSHALGFWAQASQPSAGTAHAGLFSHPRVLYNMCGVYQAKGYPHTEIRSWFLSPESRAQGPL